ncbi:MAG TPA: hypothetical protein VNQ50_03505 [Xanthobacteraceae bacterium]|nr:hypothetical protein [Xanthobacteraceae bacterium]
MAKVGMLLTVSLIAMALASPADAARRGPRSPAQTGPLIMTGMWGPQAGARQGVRRARKADICRPVTIKRGGWSSVARKAF